MGLMMLLTTLGTGAQQSTEQPSRAESDAQPLESFFGRVDVDVVEVTVWVADKQGNPVHGLGPDDFQVFEDGAPVELTNFLEVRGGEPESEVAPPPAEPVAQAEPSADEEVATPGDASAMAVAPERPLHLAVYIDNFNIAPANRRWAMQAVERFLVSRLRPRDRVLLATYDRDLHIRQPFTRDRFAVIDAIGETLRVVAEQSSRDAERRGLLEEIFTSGSSSSALYAAERHARYIEIEMGRALNALRDFVDSLSGLEGRKALLYAADGLPDTPAEDLFVAVDQRFQDRNATLRARRYDLHTRYQELIRLANASGVTLYTLDAKGQPLDAHASAEYSGVLQHMPNANVNVIEITRRQNLAAPMLSLAVGTGGRAIQRTNALDEALARVGQDFTDYYSLGYRRAAGGEERYHSIDVRLKQKGLKVRHREGYLEKSAETRLREGVEAALHHGMESNPLAVELHFQQPESADEGDWHELPVEIRIPLDRVALIPRGNEYQGRMEVAVAVVDTKGRSSPPVTQPPLDLRIPASDWPEAQSKYYTYTLRLRVRDGRQRVTVAVHDALANQTSYVTERVSIGG